MLKCYNFTRCDGEPAIAEGRMTVMRDRSGRWRCTMSGCPCHPVAFCKAVIWIIDLAITQYHRAEHEPSNSKSLKSPYLCCSNSPTACPLSVCSVPCRQEQEQRPIQAAKISTRASVVVLKSASSFSHHSRRASRRSTSTCCTRTDPVLHRRTRATLPSTLQLK